MKFILAVALAAALSGCAAVPGRFDNILLTTLAGDRAFIASTYGPFGITSELRREDAAEIARLRARAAR